MVVTNFCLALPAWLLLSKTCNPFLPALYLQQIILKIYGLFGLPIPSCVIPIVGEPLPVEAVRLGGVGGHVAHRRGGLVALPRVLAAVHHAVTLRVEVVLRLRYKMCLLTTLDLTRKRGSLSIMYLEI